MCHRWPDLVMEDLEQGKPTVTMLPAMLPISDDAAEVWSGFGS